MSMPTCDGWCNHTGAPTHIDQSGFIYCTPCGLRRRMHEPCRKMQPYEIRRIERGLTIARY